MANILTFGGNIAVKEYIELDKRVGQAVARYRKAAGLSQAEVAEMLGLSNDAISKMERGNITLNVTRLFEFAHIYGCQATDFLTISSPHLEDQYRYLSKLLQRLPAEERESLLHLIEQMIDWKENKS